MEENNKFAYFLDLKSKYFENPSKSLKEEIEKEVSLLVSSGWITFSMRVVYDLDVEKYTTIGLKGLSLSVYDKDKSIKAILRETFKPFLPKNILDEVPAKRLIFHPHKPPSYNEDGISYANTFIQNKFLSFIQDKNKKINVIEWGNYPTIKALFENVFKTKGRMDYFINWLAYGLQTKSKTRTSIISKGIQGTGKGVIYKYIIQYAVGERYTTLLENEALKSRFNGELENKLFVLANEIKADFREGNSTYERLKMYVSDSDIRFEEKNTKARTIPNFFNIWFHSNNDIPLQIQGGDRRYTVFNTKSKKLEEVSKELGLGATQYFIEEIIKERDKFIFEIMSLEYNMDLATKPMQTDEKELIYEQSMTRIEVLSDKIKKRDIEYFKDSIEDFYESGEFELFRDEIRKMNINNPLEFARELQKQFNGNYIKNNMSRVLYKIFVSEKESDRKIGLHLNTHLGKSIVKNIKPAFKYRKIDIDKDVIFLEYIKKIEKPITNKTDSINMQMKSIEELIKDESRHHLFDMNEQKERLEKLRYGLNNNSDLEQPNLENKLL